MGLGTFVIRRMDASNLQEILQSTGLSFERLMYGVRLFRVVNELKKYPELCTIRIRHDLPVQSISTLQKLAKCMGIDDSEEIDSKDVLIQMILEIHAELMDKPKTDQTLE